MDPLSFRSAVKTYIKRAGLSSTVIARRLHYTPTQFDRWLLGVEQTQYMISDLAYLLGLTPEEELSLFSLAGYVIIRDKVKQPRETKESQKDCGGRPRDGDNDWAFEQVYTFRRRCQDVYQEWLARREDHGTLDQLADPYDSFKKALSRRQKQGK